MREDANFVRCIRDTKLEKKGNTLKITITKTYTETTSDHD
jgi:hypothetical protein